MAQLILIGDTWHSDMRWNGKRKRLSLSHDKRIAQSMLDDMILLRRAQRRGEAPEQVSWVFFKKEFVRHSIAKRSKTTHRLNMQAIRMLENTCQMVHTSDLNPKTLDTASTRWIERYGKDQHHAIINRLLRALKTIGRKAEAWKYKKADDWTTVEMLKESAGRLVYYTPKELHHLLTFTKGAWRTIGLLGARAGLRRSEIHWLSWDDVDFQEGRLHVVGKDGWQPKTPKSTRWIPMCKLLAGHLRALPRASRWVLGDDRPDTGTMTTMWIRFVKNAGLRGSIHTLRHTFASHLVQQGVPLKEVAELLGHSSIKQTEIYAHLAPANMESAITKLPALDGK